MSLDVEAPHGLGASEERAIHTIWQTLDGVMLTLQQAGIGVIERPVYQLKDISPNELSNANSHQYSQWFIMYESWHSYYSQLNTYYNLKRVEAENEMKILGAKIRAARRNDKPKPNEDMLKDFVLTDSRYVELLQLSQQLEQAEKWIEPHYEKVKKRLALLSRNLTAQQLELELGGRGQRYGRP